MIKNLAGSDHLPDYRVEFDPQKDMVTFINRGTMKAAEPATEAWMGALDPDIYGDARNIAPGWDVHHLEREWRMWLGDNEIAPKNPERHFIKFCETWFAKRGQP